MFEKKPLPRPSLSLVLHPEDDPSYHHFEDALNAPFDTTPGPFSRINAWWLADASLLSYWPPEAARQIFNDQAHLDSVAIQRLDTQAYVVSNHAFTLVAFRGTQPDSLIDILSDARIALKPWDVRGERVHEGFMGALDVVWDDIVAALTPLADRPVWFTGHSLGAALATLCIARHTPRAVYTFGSPLVGNRAFGETLKGVPIFRVVDDIDGVTMVPPPILGYLHVGEEHKLSETPEPPLPIRAEKLAFDHAPVNYVDRL